MITGFEEYTKELTKYEREQILPRMIKGIRSNIGAGNPITNRAAIEAMRQRGLDISDSRFRKIMHVIRVSGMVEGIVANSNGYFIAETVEEWESYIKGLNERIRHITTMKRAIDNQFDNWKRDRQ